MQKITKSKEPAGWMRHRLTPGADFDSADKGELRQVLMHDQHGLCAYCQRRISNDGHKTRIEHIISQKDIKSGNPSVRSTLEFANLVLCCDGNLSNSSNGKDFHCDRSKGERSITFDLFSTSCIQTVKYQKNGEVHSTDTVYDNEIQNILNLNLPRLVANRVQALDAMLKILRKTNFSKQSLQERLKSITVKHPPYAGIMEYFLKKKIKSIQ